MKNNKCIDCKIACYGIRCRTHHIKNKLNINNKSWFTSERMKGNTNGFKKGDTAWNKGRKLTENERKDAIKNLGNRFAGKTHTDEHKKYMSKKFKGRPKTPGSFTKESRKKIVLPKKDTSIEVKIQNFLKELRIEYFTHQYMKIEHGYQCDILIPSMNLVIECDGDYWHGYPTGRDIDHIRTSELISSGFKVLRLWEYEIKAMNINEFKERIQ